MVKRLFMVLILGTAMTCNSYVSEVNRDWLCNAAGIFPAM